MTVTEIATVTLKPDDGKRKELTQYLCETITAQKGCEGLWYGMQVEEPDKMELVINWKEYDDHKRFMESSAYISFKERVVDSLAGSPDSLVINHIDFRTPVSAAVSGPINEMLLLYVAPDAGDEVAQSADALVAAVQPHQLGCGDVAHGWVVEELEHEGVEGKLKGYMLVISWKSLEQHQAYRQTDDFKQHVIPAIGKHAKGRAVHHTSFTKYQK